MLDLKSIICAGYSCIIHLQAMAEEVSPLFLTGDWNTQARVVLAKYQFAGSVLISLRIQIHHFRLLCIQIRIQVYSVPK